MAYNYPYFYNPRKYSNYNYNYGKYGYSKYYGNMYAPKIEKQTQKEIEKAEPVLNNDISNKEDRESSESRECFEIFGIKLFFDDILLICLIFFLYNEGVKDQYLFISLILLLLS